MLPASGDETVQEGDHFLFGVIGRKEPAHAPAPGMWRATYRAGVTTESR
jgi:hypothetical protein